MHVVSPSTERRFVLLFAVAAAIGGATPAAAQDAPGTVAGRVTAAAGAGLADANVRLYTGTTSAGVATTGADGQYRIVGVRPGTYTVRVTRIGYQPSGMAGVQVRAGETQTVNIALNAATTQLSEVVVTAAGATAPERVQDSPNAITAVPQVRIVERPAITVTDHIKAVPGLSVSTGGLMQANIVSRGFNNAFSTQMLMLQDYRFAGVPSLRVNVPALFTGTGEDIERIEVLQGPAAALYGPNSGNGVLHVITKSPFRYPGTTLTVDGGERSFGRISGRTAAVLVPERLAVKLSGEYFTAKDFEYVDPNEPARFSSTDTRVPTSRRGQVVSRDFDINKMSGEARLDFRPDSNTELISTAGMSRIGRGLEITTTFGAAQVKNWSYLNLQERFRHKRFFAQLFYNKSNSGNDNALDDQGTYYLRTGIPVVDKSSVLVGQAQQAAQLGRTKVVVGGEYIATRPETEGTINGRNEGNDDINEYGGYVQTTTAITPKLDVLLAGRVDGNSRVEGTQFSPRAALVLKPTANHTFRATFNRAFGSPAPFSFFLDQYSGQTPAPGLPVQILGNAPKQGWTFARTCAGGAADNLCMRSPYVPNTLAPASAAAAFPGFVQALPTIVRGLPVSSFGTQGEAARQQLLGLLTQLAPLTSTLRPTNAQIGTVLLDLNTRTPVTGAPRDLAPLGANFSNTYELGYKGQIGQRLGLTTDLWFQRRPSDPTTQIVNPGVLFNPTQLGAYLGQTVGPAIAQSVAQQLIAAGVPAATAQQQAAAQASAAVTNITTLMAQIPVGATAFTSALYDQPYLVFTYQNSSGYVNVHGVDASADLHLTDTWSVEGTYAWLSKNVFPDAPGATAANPLVANTPQHRATATVRYANEVQGLSAEVRGRYADAFQVNSGVFNSYGIPATAVRYPSVPVNAFLDAGVSYRFNALRGARVSLNATNILDNEVPTFVGTPAIGRMIITRLQYTF